MGLVLDRHFSLLQLRKKQKNNQLPYSSKRANNCYSLATTDGRLHPSILDVECTEYSIAG